MSRRKIDKAVPDFALISKEAFEATPNDSTGFHVLAALMLFRNRKTGLCCPSVETLANLTGRSVSTVRRTIARHEKAGILKRIARKTERGTNDTNEYCLSGHVCPPTRSEMTAPPGHVCRAPPCGDDRHNREEEQRRVTDTLSSSSENKEPFQLEAKPKGNCSKVKPNDDADAFNEFWDAYPKKVAKRRAETAFKKSVAREGGDDDARQRIVDAAKAFAKTPTGQAGKFCPHPTTWLSDDRFNDDPKEWNQYDGKDATKYRPTDVDRRAAEKIEV